MLFSLSCKSSALLLKSSDLVRVSGILPENFCLFVKLVFGVLQTKALQQFNSILVFADETKIRYSLDQRVFGGVYKLIIVKFQGIVK
jgi:hypothetical protein